MPSEKEIEEAIKWANFMTGTSNPAQEKLVHTLRDAYLYMKSERDGREEQIQLMGDRIRYLETAFTNLASERDKYKGDFEATLNRESNSDVINKALVFDLEKTREERDKYKEIVEKDTEVIDAILKHDGLDRISIRNFHTSDCSILSGFTNGNQGCDCFYQGMREALSLRDKKEE